MCLQFGGLNSMNEASETRNWGICHDHQTKDDEDDDEEMTFTFFFIKFFIKWRRALLYHDVFWRQAARQSDADR